MIEMQGPGVFLNPPNQPIYQETQVKLPENVVGVGQGIDWGAIGESVAKFGTELVSYDIEDKRNKKKKLLEDLETRTKMGIDHASAINDFDSVDAQISEYKKGVKDIVGYEIDSDGEGQTSSYLLEQARQTSYGFELYGQKARRETADDVKLSAFNDDSLQFREKLLTSDNQSLALEERIAQLGQMAQDAEAKEQKTMGDRAFGAAVRKERIELLEIQAKMRDANAKNIQDVKDATQKKRQDRIINLNKSLGKQWEQLSALTKQADSLASKADKTEAELQEHRSVQTKLNALAFNISKSEAILEQEQNDFAMEFFGGKWDNNFAANNLGKEEYNVIVGVNDNRTTALDSISLAPFKRQAEAQRSQVKTVNDQVDSIISAATAEIAAYDSAIKVASDAERAGLISRRNLAITRIEQDLIEVVEAGVPTFARDLTQTVSGLKFFGESLPYKYSTSELSVAAANAVEAEKAPYETIYKTFRPTVDKFNNFLSTRLDIPNSTGGGGSGDSDALLKRRLENLMIIDDLQKHKETTASPERINEAMIERVQLGGVNPYKENGVLKSWKELAPELKKANIVLPANGFIHTEFFSSFLDDLLRNNTPLEEWDARIADAFSSPENEFYSGVFSGTNRAAINAAKADLIVGGLQNEVTRTAAMAAFMLFTPPDRVQENINMLRASGKAEAIGMATVINELEAHATGHQGNGSPIKYIQERRGEMSSDVLSELQRMRKLIRDRGTQSQLLGTYSAGSRDTVSEEVKDKVLLTTQMADLRENVFDKLTVRLERDGIDPAAWKNNLTGNYVNETLRQVSEIALGHLYEAAFNTKTKYKDDELWAAVIQRTNESLKDFKFTGAGLVPARRDVQPLPAGLRPTFTSGSGISYDLQDDGKQDLAIILDSNWDTNGLDKNTFSQFGIFSEAPNVENPTALVLAASTVKGADLSSIPGDPGTNLMAIAEAVLGGKKDNRTLLIAQAAIKDTRGAKTVQEAISLAKTNMKKYMDGLERGDFVFGVDTEKSNINKSQLVSRVVLQQKGGSIVATFQPTPIRKSLAGTDVHRNAMKRVTKEQFGQWATRQINDGTVDHAKVVDYLTANGITKQSLSETTQWVSLGPVLGMSLPIPVSIPNEDYTYEYVNHLGTPQWFVTKDGEPRKPVKGFIDTTDLKPSSSERYVYTGAEKGLSRRTGVTGIAGKPLLMYEWKGMGTNWMLDKSRYDMTVDSTSKQTLQPEELEFQTQWRNVVQAPTPFQQTLGEFLAPTMRPRSTEEDRPQTSDGFSWSKFGNEVRKLVEPGGAPQVEQGRQFIEDQNRRFALLGVTTETTAEPESRLGVRSNGLIDQKTVLTTVAGKPIVISYSKPTLSDNWVMDVIEPEVEESESTNGFMDFKRVSAVIKGVGASFIYSKPISSKNWSLIQGPMVTDIGGAVIRSLEQGYAEDQLFSLTLPSTNLVAKAAAAVSDPIEKFTMITGEILRQAQLALKIHPTNKYRRQEYVRAHEAYMRSISLSAERNRIRNQPKQVIRDFENYVSKEADYFVEYVSNKVDNFVEQ